MKTRIAYTPMSNSPQIMLDIGVLHPNGQVHAHLRVDRTSVVYKVLERGQVAALDRQQRHIGRPRATALVGKPNAVDVALVRRVLTDRLVPRAAALVQGPQRLQLSVRGRHGAAVLVHRTTVGEQVGHDIRAAGDDGPVERVPFPGTATLHQISHRVQVPFHCRVVDGRRLQRTSEGDHAPHNV